MKAPFLQPFKCITLPVSVTGTNSTQIGTNDGVIDDSRVGKNGNNHKYPNGPDSYMLKNDAAFSPVRMKSSGVAELATDGTKPVIGVLMESFTQPLQPHEIMVEGIVWMQNSSSTPINPGDLVMPATAKANTRRTRIKKAETGNYAFGIALQKASAEGDWISVLIGTTGGKIG